jgi:hypothetical protein
MDCYTEDESRISKWTARAATNLVLFSDQSPLEAILKRGVQGKKRKGGKK